MSIQTSDILLKLSTTTGPGNSTAGSPNSSLGGFISTTQVTNNSLHNLFDEISGTENAASESEYRCVFVHNSNATDTFFNVIAFISAEVAGGADVAIGVDAVAASAVGATDAQADDVVDEDTAPSGVAFTSPTVSANGIDIGDLASGEVRGVWIRRTAANTVALENDGTTLRVQGESL